MQRAPNTSQLESFAPYRRRLLAWAKKAGRALPWRRTRDPYAVLVSEIMLQQTTVATVQPRYEAWLRRFPTIETLARAPENDVLHAWQGLGYYNRARNLHRCAQVVITELGGKIPPDLASLRQLPGLGRYTAAAVAVFAFGQSLPLVEANTARVLARLQDLQEPIDAGAGHEKLWDLSARLVPRREARAFQNAMMDLGALVCTARNPKCEVCPVRSFCRATTPEELPRKRRRAPQVRSTERHELVFHGDAVVLARSTLRWRGLWMLPRSTARAEILHREIFPFTHHQITLEVVRGKKRAIKADELIFARKDLAQIPMPSPHRRALDALLA